MNFCKVPFHLEIMQVLSDIQWVFLLKRKWIIDENNQRIEIIRNNKINAIKLLYKKFRELMLTFQEIFVYVVNDVKSLKNVLII